jgi:hypothetical protein
MGRAGVPRSHASTPIEVRQQLDRALLNSAIGAVVVDYGYDSYEPKLHRRLWLEARQEHVLVATWSSMDDLSFYLVDSTRSAPLGMVNHRRLHMISVNVTAILFRVLCMTNSNNG